MFHLLKVNNKNTSKKVWNVFKVNDKNVFSGVFIVNFEHISNHLLVFIVDFEQVTVNWVFTELNIWPTICKSISYIYIYIYILYILIKIWMIITLGKTSQLQLPTKTTISNDQASVNFFEKVFDWIPGTCIESCKVAVLFCDNN